MSQRHLTKDKVLDSGLTFWSIGVFYKGLKRKVSKMYKLTLALLLVVSFCIGCPGGSDSDSVERNFYIESHEIKSVYKPCFLDVPLKEEKPLYEDDVYILYPRGSYVLFVDYFNDQDNTEWIQFEIFVDGKRWSSRGSIIEHPKNGPKDDKTIAYITLFETVPFTLEGKEVVVDVWLEDENGIQSEVYTFEVVVRQLWYLN